MNNRANGKRLPWMFFGAIALIAIIIRLVSPAPPPVPGPIGSMPNWKSSIANGEMGPWAVNPAGTMWAGVWNEKGKDGKVSSAVWVVDFEKQEARKCVLQNNSLANVLVWPDDKTLNVAGAKDVAEDKSRRAIDTTTIDTSTMTNKLAPVASSNVRHTCFYYLAVKGSTYSYGSDMTALPKTAFTADQIPGVIEKTWVSSTGILVLCRHMDTFKEFVYDAKTEKLIEVGKDGFTTDVKKNWPDAPKEMLFVTYRGGFSYDLYTNKTRKLFDYKNLGANDDYWRSSIQDGRLYPNKDGYTSVSFDGKLIDIRALDKNGRLKSDLLPRQ